MTYTIEYFIEKFEAIPEELWTAGIMHDRNGKYCALGHCGVLKFDLLGTIRFKYTDESHALMDIFKQFHMYPEEVNDFPRYNDRFKANSPKTRILGALRQFKGNIDYFKNL